LNYRHEGKLKKKKKEVRRLFVELKSFVLLTATMAAIAKIFMKTTSILHKTS
jgi:hypothetical protein